MANRSSHARALANMRLAISPKASLWPAVPLSDEEIWPDLTPEDFDLGELAIEDVELDDYELGTFWSLFDELWTDGLLVPLEQCCDAGLLLPPELREARLRRFPLDLGAQLEARMRRIPPPMLATLAMHVYWTLRCSRARRTGSAELSAALLGT